MNMKLPQPESSDTPPATRLKLAHAVAHHSITATNKPAVVLHARVVAGRTGGPDKTIFRSLPLIDPTRYQVHVVYIHPQGDPIINELHERAQKVGCQLHTIAESGALDMRTVLTLKRLCRELKVDIWHGHDYKTNALGLLLRRFHPMKLVTTAHGWTDETARTRLYHKLDDLMLPRYDRVMTVSRPLWNHCLMQGLDTTKLSYIPNGIDIADYQNTGQRDVIRAQLQVDDHCQLIGLVGRLSAEKSIDRALHTLARLTAMRHDVKLLLVGDGPEREALVKLAADLHITERVHFAGWQKDAKPYYQAMDLLLLSSLTEGMPNVVLEAMAMGVPVAATDVGDVNYLLDDGRCGLVLSPSADDWALPLGYWLPQHDELQRKARLAKQRVMNHFSFAQRIERELAVYDDVLDRQPEPLRQTRAA